ncbi:RE1 [Symbiodinium sp. CCMP2592]|nr:RE1 [Symbiodinium sp. CCMP2592]
MAEVRVQMVHALARVIVHICLAAFLAGIVELWREPSILALSWEIIALFTWLMYSAILTGQVLMTTTFVRTLFLILNVCVLVGILMCSWASNEEYLGRFGMTLGSQILLGVVFPSDWSVRTSLCYAAAFIFSFTQVHGSQAMNAWFFIQQTFQLGISNVIPHFIDTIIRRQIAASCESEDSDSLIVGFRRMLRGICDGDLLLDGRLCAPDYAPRPVQWVKHWMGKPWFGWASFKEAHSIHCDEPGGANVTANSGSRDPAVQGCLFFESGPGRTPVQSTQPDRTVDGLWDVSKRSDSGQVSGNASLPTVPPSNPDLSTTSDQKMRRYDGDERDETCTSDDSMDTEASAHPRLSEQTSLPEETPQDVPTIEAQPAVESGPTSHRASVVHSFLGHLGVSGMQGLAMLGLGLIILTHLASAACMMHFSSGSSVRNPPLWGPEMQEHYAFRAWTHDVLVWSVACDADPARKAAMLAMSLRGTAYEYVRTLPPMVLIQGGQINGHAVDPLTFLMHSLAERFGTLGEEMRLTSITDLFHFKRNVAANERIDEVITRFDMLRQRAFDMGQLTISVTGLTWLLLRACEVSDTQLLQLLGPLQGRFPQDEAEFSALKVQLRRMGHILEHSPGNIAASLRGPGGSHHNPTRAYLAEAGDGTQPPQPNAESWNEGWSPGAVPTWHASDSYSHPTTQVWYAEDSENGTDTDTASSSGETVIPQATPEGDTDPQALTEYLFWAYTRAKAAWRKHLHKPTRAVRRHTRRYIYSRSKGSKNSKGKGYKGRPNVSTFLAELGDDEVEYVFKGMRKGKGPLSGLIFMASPAEEGVPGPMATLIDNFVSAGQAVTQRWLGDEAVSSATPAADTQQYDAVDDTCPLCREVYLERQVSKSLRNLFTSKVWDMDISSAYGVPGAILVMSPKDDELRLIVPGPAGCKVKLCPGTIEYPLFTSPSGHLLLRCDQFQNTKEGSLGSTRLVFTAGEQDDEQHSSPAAATAFFPHGLDVVLNQGGDLWLELGPDQEVPPTQAVQRRKPNGQLIYGQLLSTHQRLVRFNPKLMHAVQPWTGERISISAYTSRSLDQADESMKRHMRRLLFPLPPSRVTVAVASPSLSDVHGKENHRSVAAEHPASSTVLHTPSVPIRSSRLAVVIEELPAVSLVLQGAGWTVEHLHHNQVNSSATSELARRLKEGKIHAVWSDMPLPGRHVPRCRLSAHMTQLCVWMQLCGELGCIACLFGAYGSQWLNPSVADLVGRGQLVKSYHRACVELPGHPCFYPTEERLRQKQRLKAMKDRGETPKTRKMVVEDHHDDCGTCLDSLIPLLPSDSPEEKAHPAHFTLLKCTDPFPLDWLVGSQAKASLPPANPRCYLAANAQQGVETVMQWPSGVEDICVYSGGAHDLAYWAVRRHYSSGACLDMLVQVDPSDQPSAVGLLLYVYHQKPLLFIMSPSSGIHASPTVAALTGRIAFAQHESGRYFACEQVCPTQLPAVAPWPQVLAQPGVLRQDVALLAASPAPADQLTVTLWANHALLLQPHRSTSIPPARFRDAQAWPWWFATRVSDGACLVRCHHQLTARNALQMYPSVGVGAPSDVTEDPPGQELWRKCPGCRGKQAKYDNRHNRIPGQCKYPDEEKIDWACPGCKAHRPRTHSTHTYDEHCRYAIVEERRGHPRAGRHPRPPARKARDDPTADLQAQLPEDQGDLAAGEEAEAELPSSIPHTSPDGVNSPGLDDDNLFPELDLPQLSPAEKAAGAASDARARSSLEPPAEDSTQPRRRREQRTTKEQGSGQETPSDWSRYDVSRSLRVLRVGSDNAVRLELRKLHLRLWHASRQSMTQILRAAGVSNRVIEMIPDIINTCRECRKWARPGPNTQHALTASLRFNQHVEVDLLFYRTHIVLHLICRATRWHGGCVVQSKQGEELFEALQTAWIGIHGPMETLVSDGESGLWREEIAGRLKRQGVNLKPRAPQQHARFIERRGAVLRVTMHVMQEQLDREGLVYTFPSLLAEAIFAGNALTHVGGSTPYQAVYGRQPAMLPALDAPDHQDHESISAAGDRQRASIRHAALQAMIQATSLARLNRAAHTRTSPDSTREYQAEDLVDVYRKPTSKDASGWVGPYRVVRSEPGQVVVKVNGVALHTTDQDVTLADVCDEAATITHETLDRDMQPDSDHERTSIHTPQGPLSAITEEATDEPEELPEAELSAFLASCTNCPEVVQNTMVQIFQLSQSELLEDPACHYHLAGISPASYGELENWDDAGNGYVELWFTREFSKVIGDESLLRDQETYVLQVFASGFRNAVIKRESHLLTTQELQDHAAAVRAASVEELRIWDKYKCFKRVPRATAHNIMDSKAVVKWKVTTTPNGQTSRIPRARLALRGFKDLQANDIEAHASTASRLSQRMLCSEVACRPSWKFVTVDVNKAFLQGMSYDEIHKLTGETEREVHFTLPHGWEHHLRKIPGYENFCPRTEVLKCLKPGTGCKDAPRAFSLKLATFTRSEKIGLRPSTYDPELELKVTATGILVLVLAKHVDDLKIAGEAPEVDALISYLESGFGKLSYQEGTFTNCGLQHIRMPDGSVQMNQHEYINAMRPIHHPELAGRRSDEPCTAEVHSLFQSLLGAVAYCLLSQSWAAVFVVALQRRTTNPLNLHVRRLNLLLRALQKQKSSLVFPAMTCKQHVLVYSDASFDKETENKGYGMRGTVFLRMGARNGQPCCHLLEAQSQSLKLVTRSTFASETLAAVGAIDNLTPLLLTFEEFTKGALSPARARQLREVGGFAFSSELCIDAMNLFYALTAAYPRLPAEKTLFVHISWLRDTFQRGVPRTVSWSDTRDMVADGLTKGKVDRTALLEAMRGVLHVRHPKKSHEGSKAASSPGPSS